MQLTPRADKIIRILLRFSPDSPVTIGIISEELGVSDRSVQRELPTVEKWMKHNGFCFVRKRSVGLLIDETPERLKELAALLDEKDTNSSAPADNRPERLTLLCHDLLLAEEPIKSYYFTEKFEISEGTLTADLNQLETWFTKYQLKLVRRPGLGVFIEGTEIARRQALTSFICKQVNEHHSIGNLQDKKFLSDRNFINEIDGEVMAEVNHILGGCQKQLGMQLSDNGYLHLLVYTSLCVQRMQKGRFIKELKQSYAEISIQPEYAVSEYIMKELRQFFHLSISVDETIYMAVFISGQRIWPSGSRDLTDIKNLDVHQITLSIIKKVNEILHINFMRDSRLLTELSGHIQPTIARLRAGIPVENPLLKEFQESYPSVYKACEEGLSLLCPILGIKKVPASEIGFITLYFTMAMERIEKEIKKALNASYPEMFELYDKVINWEYVRNKDIYEQINAEYIPFEENGQLKQITEAIIDQSFADLENVTNSLGFYLDYGNGKKVLTPLSQVYTKYLDAACYDIVTGAFDYNSVLRRVVTQLTNSGLRQIDYSSGRANRVDVAARRAVMTGVAKLTHKITEYHMEQLGCEYVEVSWHAGARPSHSVWQVYKWNK